MFSARFTRQQGIPVVAVVAGTVALATLTAACGASGSSSSAAALSAPATEHASAAARPVSTASAGVSKAAGVGKTAGVSKTAGAGKPADPGKTVAASGSAGTTSSADGAGRPAGTATSAGAGNGNGKLTGAAATALLSKAVANTKAASSVQVTGQAVPTGSGSQTESFDLTLVRNSGCEGAVTLSPAKSFKVVASGGYIWMMPSDAYYASTHMSRQNLAKVENKYIKMKATASQASDLATVCTFPGLLGQLDRPAGTAFEAVPATQGADPGYRVTEAGQHGAAFVAKTPAPLLLRISGLRPDDGSITFAGYDATGAITIPGAAETIDSTSK